MLVKMPPSKTDTYRIIFLKIRTVRLKDSLSDANPLKMGINTIIAA